MTDFDDDADLLVTITDELNRLHEDAGALAMQLPPIMAMQLAGLLQLALQRPDLIPTSRAVAVDLLLLIRTYFASCPAVLDVLTAGDSPGQRPPSATQTRH